MGTEITETADIRAHDGMQCFLFVYNVILGTFGYFLYLFLFFAFCLHSLESLQINRSCTAKLIQHTHGSSSSVTCSPRLCHLLVFGWWNVVGVGVGRVPLSE